MFWAGLHEIDSRQLSLVQQEKQETEETAEMELSTRYSTPTPLCKVTKAAGITREALYQALRPNAFQRDSKFKI